jgi:hypothetical protein
MFADDALVDIRYDELARMLAFEKPPGTLAQFRYSTTPDPGQAITSVISSRAHAGTHTLASLLQSSNLDYLRGTAQSLPYRRGVLTMWLRVPPKKRDNSTMNALAGFQQALRQEMREHGFFSTVRHLPQLYSRTADDSVVRRALEDEQRAYSHANRVWRQFENSSPLTLRRFTRQEIWEAVFFGHCQNASSAPVLPERPGRDLRDYLCGETVEGELNYLMHGEYPVAIVSMFTPPNEFVTADALRGLIGRRDFNSRHTILTEYLFPEQRKEIIAHAKLSENGAAAISHIKTAPGRFSQFVMVIGTGPDQIVEVVQHELSPLMLWTLTTNADERNARSIVSAYHPEWSETQIHAWLSQRYPRGLTAVGLREIDESLLAVAA